MQKFLFIILIFFTPLCITEFVPPVVYAADFSLSAQEQNFIRQTPQVVLAGGASFEPFLIKNPDGSISGFDVDIANLIKEKTGLNITFQLGQWKDIQERAKNREFDGLSTAGINEERLAFYNFSSPYVRFTSMIIVKKGNPKGIFNLSDLEGKRAALQEGNLIFQKILSRINSKIDIIHYPKIHDLLRSVASGEADFTILDESALYVARMIGLSNFIEWTFPVGDPFDLVFCLRKDRPELVTIINKGLAQFTEQEKRNIRNRWFGSPVKESVKPSNTISPNDAEQDFLDAHSIIRVANELDYAPFDFTIGNKPQGYSIDLLNILAERIGITLSYINGYTWDQLQTMFKKGKIDLLHSINKIPERQNMGIYSEPYHYYKNHWIVRKDQPEIDRIEQLYGKTVAVGKGWSQEEFFKSSYPKIRLLVVDGLDSMLDVVSSGKADAMVGEISVIRYILKKKSTTALKISGWAKEFDQGGNRKFHFMAQNNAPELISILNKAFASLTPGDIDELDRKWFGNKENEDFGSDVRITLNPDEKKYLAEKGNITISAYLDWMPYQRVNKNGRLEGMAADYLSIFEKRIGVPFQIFHTRTAKETITSVQENKADAVFLQDVSGALSEHLDVSTPYISDPYVIATATNQLFINDIGSKLDKTFVALRGASIIKRLQQRYPEIQLLEVDTVVEGLERVRDGDTFGYIDTSSVIVYAIQDVMMPGVKIAGKLPFNIELAVAVRNSEPLLSSILQKAVDSLTDSEKQQIDNQWTAVKFEKGIDYALVWKTIIITIIIVSGMMFWNRKLHIAQKTTQQALEKLGDAQEQLQTKNEELERLSITDQLTGLYNRMKLDQILKREILRFKRYNSIVSLIIVDIDYFKKVNDTFGHQVGDKVLQEVASTLRNNVREVDFVGRWGGEEFLVICPETNLAMAISVAEKLRTEVERRNKDNELNVTASFGVAELANDEGEAGLIHKADSALYMAKENGRNRVESI